MARTHDHARVDWKHLLFYGLAMAVVLLVGAVALWSFVEKQSVREIAAEPLPKITIVTADPNSPLAAAWVTILTKAGLSPTLVPLEKFDPIEGVVLFCDIPVLPPKLAQLLDTFVHRGGAIAFAGMPPSTPIGKLTMTADSGESGTSIHFSESVSPLLARLNPGYDVGTQSSPVAFLKESPRMVVDARWAQNARAAIMHLESEGSRYLWFGFSPEHLYNREDLQVQLLLRTAFRWAAGQPISDGAVGAPQAANTLTADARRAARASRFAFSVDRMKNRDQFRVQMMNRGPSMLQNPTVKVWLPPRVTEVALGGDPIMRRNTTLTAVPGEAACVVGLRNLARNEERVLKLKVVQERSAAEPAGDER